MKKYDKWMIVYQHFKNFVGGSCTFGDLTIELCQKFRDYLLNAKQLKHTYKKVKRNSAAGYFSTFRALLKMAYKEKWLRENLNDHLESIEWEDVRKEFLTKKELDILVKTPCDIPVLKSASLFSCLTGLRISDILNLKWENIMVGADNVYYMRIRTEKTATEATLPIGRDALSLFGERSTGKVFKGLERSMIQHPLKKWITQAGITKHITFHCFRHTYATLQLAYGTDIYTVSKMLTHKNVQTTQIYANIIDAKKWEAANRITLKIE